MVSDIEVLLFRSQAALYGVMARQIANLSGQTSGARAPDVDVIDVVRAIEGSGSISEREEREYVITDHEGFRYRVPGRAELRALPVDVFRVMPPMVLRVHPSNALRAVFFADDLVGFLVDLCRVRAPISTACADATHQRMV
jgi:hypothetical protein